MRSLTVALLVILGSLCLCGCAWTPQHITLAPELGDYSPTKVGRLQAVGVQALDERPDKTLGHRSTGAVGAKMTIDDPEGIVSATVMESLRMNGFTAVEYDPALPRNLKIEIREIDFYLSKGIWWSGGVHTSASLKVIATNGPRTYEEFYRAENERRTLVAPGEGDNERDVNETLSEAIQKIHHDNELMQFLARP